MPLKDLLTQSGLNLTPAEGKIVQALLADYPTSGLGTASNLAKRAGVSDPTVARLSAKLGFESFADLQAMLITEIEARLQSPLLMFETKRTAGDGPATVQTYLQSVAHRVAETETAVPAQNYDQAVDLIMAAKGRVLLLCGRFSRHLAGILAGYLGQFRGQVTDLARFSAESFDLLLELGNRDVLIVFDYRRYQTDIVRFATQAAERGVRLILFTDQWLSPVAEKAEVVFIAPSEVNSPYDTLVPALAQLEALSLHAVMRSGDAVKRRIQALEDIRSSVGVTVSEKGAQQPIPNYVQDH